MKFTKGVDKVQNRKLEITVGSSRIRSSGSWSKATASDARLCWPPLMA